MAVLSVASLDVNVARLYGLPHGTGVNRREAVTVTVLLVRRDAEQAVERQHFEVDGPTVEAALQALPVADLVLLDGEIRPLVNVYLDEVDVRELDGAATLVQDGAELRVVADLAGDS